MTWLLLWLAMQQPMAHYRHRDGWVLPDSLYTPGKVRTTDTSIICHGTTKTVRHTTAAMKRQVYREYGLDPNPPHQALRGRRLSSVDPIHAGQFETGTLQSVAQVATSPAYTASAIPVRVDFVEQVPAHAVRGLSFSDAWTGTAHDIGAVRNGLQVIGVHTQRAPAQVVQLASVGNLAINGLPQQNMSPSLSPSTVTPAHHLLAGPHPALGRGIELDAVHGDPQQRSRNGSHDHIITQEWEIDHLVALELGGKDTITNLWPEPALPLPGFHQKDLTENAAHRAICTGRLSADSAQRWIAHDFPSMYDSLVHP